MLEHLVRAGAIDLLVSIGDVMRRAVENAKPFQRFPAIQFDLAGKDQRRRMLDEVEPGQTIDVRGDDISDAELA